MRHIANEKTPDEPNRVWFKTLRIVCVLGSIILASRVYALTEWPVAPAVPSTQDCENLSNAYQRLFDESSDAMFACLRGPSNVGPGMQTTNDCSTYPGVRGWPQCANAELSNCQLGKRMLEETADCYARVPSGGNAPASLSTFRDSVGLYSETLAFMVDPQKFILESLNSGSSGFASKMFDARGRLRPRYFVTANEIYAFAQNYATYGMQHGMSGLPREIALESLQQIGISFENSLASLNSAVAAINSISTSASQYETPPSYESQQIYQAPPPPQYYRPPPPRYYGPNSSVQ